MIIERSLNYHHPTALATGPIMDMVTNSLRISHLFFLHRGAEKLRVFTIMSTAAASDHPQPQAQANTARNMAMMPVATASRSDANLYKMAASLTCI